MRRRAVQKHTQVRFVFLLTNSDLCFLFLDVVFAFMGEGQAVDAYDIRRVVPIFVGGLRFCSRETETRVMNDQSFGKEPKRETFLQLRRIA